METTAAYTRRLDAGATAEEVARIAGVAPSRIARRVKLLGLCNEVASMVSAGSFPVGVAERISGLDRDRQVIAARTYARAELTGPQFDAFVSRLIEARLAESESSLFEMQVDQWVDEARQGRRYGQVGELRVMVKRLAAALEGHPLTGADAELIADARRLLAEQSNAKAARR